MGVCCFVHKTGLQLHSLVVTKKIALFFKVCMSHYCVPVSQYQRYSVVIWNKTLINTDGMFFVLGWLECLILTWRMRTSVIRRCVFSGH